MVVTLHWCAPRRPSDGKGLSHHACDGAAAETGSEGRHVRVLYNGRPVALRCAASGSDICYLAEFKRMVDAYSVRDFAAECKPCPAGDDPSSVTPKLSLNK